MLTALATPVRLLPVLCLARGPATTTTVSTAVPHRAPLHPLHRGRPVPAGAPLTVTYRHHHVKLCTQDPSRVYIGTKFKLCEYIASVLLFLYNICYPYIFLLSLSTSNPKGFQGLHPNSLAYLIRLQKTLDTGVNNEKMPT